MKNQLAAFHGESKVRTAAPHFAQNRSPFWIEFPHFVQNPASLLTLCSIASEIGVGLAFCAK
jgi:hypothetical protein